MKDLFNLIARVQPALPGWCTPEKAITLASIIVGNRPLVTVEVGVYGGSSFIPLALAHKAIGYGTAIGIDAWDKSVAIQAQTENESRVWWDNQDLEGLCQSVLNKIRELGLENVAHIIRKKSANVEPPRAIGCLHVDGAHNDEAVRDVVLYANRVEVGGLCIMDDLNWVGGGPARAAQRLIQMGFRQLYTIQDGAVYQRVR